MKRNKEYTVWRNDDFSDEHFKEAKEAYIEYLELNDRKVPEVIADSDVWEFIYEDNTMQFSDECENLGRVGADGNGFLLVADLGLWNGRRFGYKEERNVRDALMNAIGNCENAHIFVKGGKLNVTAKHHDGTNHVEIRSWKPTVTDSQMERVKDAIYARAENAWDLINRHTKALGREVAGVYGW